MDDFGRELGVVTFSSFSNQKSTDGYAREKTAFTPVDATNQIVDDRENGGIRLLFSDKKGKGDQLKMFRFNQMFKTGQITVRTLTAIFMIFDSK